MPQELVGVNWDNDCDGPSIAYYDLRKPDNYDRVSYDSYIARADFMRAIHPLLSDWSKGYWNREGYYGDHSAIRNCEVSGPGARHTLAALSHIPEVTP